jgi:xanthine dehydrogenase YagT iron-sulfur-binding subunit
MRLTVNEKTREVAPAPHESLLETLRERLFLTGAKAGCERGECGACTVLLNGEPVLACLTLTAGCDERDAVLTVEGLARGNVLHPLQAAFVAHDAVQCGFCTPGQLMAALALLQRNPSPDDAAIAQALAGNLCRCGTSPRIAEAIRAVAGSGGPGEGTHA